MRIQSGLIGYALARSLPLAAIGAVWSFSAVLGRYAGTLAAAAMYALCLMLVRTASLCEQERNIAPFSTITAACAYALLSAGRTCPGASGTIPAMIAGTADSVIIAFLSGLGLYGGLLGLLYIPAAVVSLALDLQLPLPVGAAAEIIEAVCPAGLAVCAARRMKGPVSADGLMLGLTCGLLQNILL